MARAYEEQIWAVTLISGINAFIAGYAGQLLEAFKYSVATMGISFVSILAILFVWSRHFIFVRYDTLAKSLFVGSADCSVMLAKAIPTSFELLARLSGVSFYTVVIAGMALIAIKRLKIQNKRNNA